LVVARPGEAGGSGQRWSGGDAAPQADRDALRKPPRLAQALGAPLGSLGRPDCLLHPKAWPEKAPTFAPSNG
jgi:hypothetical protein